MEFWNSSPWLSIVHVLEVFEGTQQPKLIRVWAGSLPSASTSPSMDSRPWPTTASLTCPTIQYSVVAMFDLTCWPDQYEFLHTWGKSPNSHHVVQQKTIEKGRARLRESEEWEQMHVIKCNFTLLRVCLTLLLRLPPTIVMLNSREIGVEEPESNGKQHDN